VGPKDTSTGCVRQYVWEYVGIILDILYVVYAKIGYVVYEYRSAQRGARLVLNAY